MKRVTSHRLAGRELIDSALYYDQRRAGLGEEFLSEVETVLEFIRAQPEAGRPERHATRSYPTKRFPFRIVYDIQPDRLWIVAVAHLSRRPGYWTRRLE
ncbi:MAG: type II toxin-antitoxin system RelE/ParE family toxin [Verrucomicrobia bacterium]|nr:type II toxin-antitoxin system RelE/ParE family toxin [Verrucomicrobiota bacterium]